MDEARAVDKIFRYCPKCGSDKFKSLSDREFLCSDCGFNYFVNASSATTAIIFNEKNELLLCRRARKPFKGTYELPGGFLEFGETAEHALKREIKEELNLHIEQLSYFGTYTNKYPFGGLLVNTMEVVYTGVVKDFSNLQVADDVDKVKFVMLEIVDKEEIVSGAMKEIIKDLITSKIK
ncbi:MAG: NUDIX domain-containing protein [Bacteroidales bacterium]